MELLPDGSARFRRPTGLVIQEAPPLPPVGADALTALVRRLARQGVQVDAAESLPSWDGEPTDYNWAIQSIGGLVSAGARSRSHTIAKSRPAATPLSHEEVKRLLREAK